jgi:hypothetical protein
MLAPCALYTKRTTHARLFAAYAWSPFPSALTSYALKIDRLNLRVLQAYGSNSFLSALLWFDIGTFWALEIDGIDLRALASFLFSALVWFDLAYVRHYEENVVMRSYRAK